MTRYRIDDTAALIPDDPWSKSCPLVHVFRDDELDELARRIAAEVSDGFAVDAAVIYVLRNHGSNQ